MNMMAYHRSDDITIDLMATAIWPPHLVVHVRKILNLHYGRRRYFFIMI